MRLILTCSSLSLSLSLALSLSERSIFACTKTSSGHLEPCTSSRYQNDLKGRLNSFFARQGPWDTSWAFSVERTVFVSKNARSCENGRHVVMAMPPKEKFPLAQQRHVAGIGWVGAPLVVQGNCEDSLVYTISWSELSTSTRVCFLRLQVRQST